MSTLLQGHLNLSLIQAKNCVDDVLKGKRVTLVVEDSSKAQTLAAALQEIGALVEVDK